MTEGVSGFINEGNVGALVQNVTFGLSNSAAKVTGSLSDGLGRVTMDERHEEIRQRLMKHTGQSTDHLVAGLKGFGFGILGGMTSVFTQTYEGIRMIVLNVELNRVMICYILQEYRVMDSRGFSLALEKV